MSSIIENEYFEVCLNTTSEKCISEIFHNLRELLPGWYFETHENNVFKALTIELRSETFNNLHYLVKINFKSSPDLLAITYFILHNNIPLKIESRNHQIKLYSHLMRINSNILFGKFSICPKSGFLIYNYHSFLTESQSENIRTPQSKFFKNNLEIFQTIQENCTNLEFYLITIFELLNMKGFFCKIPTEEKSLEQSHLSNTYYKELVLLQKLLPFTHEDIEFLIKSNFQIKEITTINNLNPINKVLTILNNKNNFENSSISELSSEKAKEILWLSRSNSQSTINREKTHKTSIFFSKETLEKIKNISNNVNCNVDLYSGLKFNSNEFCQKSLFYIIKKSPSSSKGEKLIEREKKFLELLMQYGGKYDIGEYFEVSTVEREAERRKSVSASKMNIWEEKSICMAYYPLNVGEYVQKRRLFMSQTSKLLLLLKIEKAISSLHRDGSQHMDLKPENIMIDNLENIRLIDFGQSILETLPLSSKPGVSIPYSPPEFFSKYKFNPFRCDIYSFGVIVYEVLFGCLPQNLPSCKEKAPVFYQSSDEYRKLFQIQPENLELVTEKKIAQLVASFCMKCMNENPILRLSESWIRVYLKKLIELSYNY